MSRPLVLENEDRPMLGIVLTLLAFGVFSFIDAPTKWLALLGLPSLQLAFMRYFAHFFISIGLLSRGGISLNQFGTDHLGLVVLRGALLMFATVLNFIAVRYLPLTLTSTILFSAPLIVCALSGPLLAEKVGVWRWTAIFIGFVGVLIAIRPFNAEFHWAVFLSLIGAFSFSIYTILTRQLAGVVATDTLQFYTGFVGTFVLLPFAIWQWQNPETMFQWIVLISLGVLGWFGHELLTRAHRFATANTLSPFSYSFIVYLTIWSYFLFDHLPDQWTILGATIIISAGMIVWSRERTNLHTT